jgi:hypothetical protein
MNGTCNLHAGCELSKKLWLQNVKRRDHFLGVCVGGV